MYESDAIGVQGWSFLGVRPATTFAQKPPEGRGTFSVLQRVAMITSEIPKSVERLLAEVSVYHHRMAKHWREGGLWFFSKSCLR
jgi:hypothetical protein